MGWFSDFQRMLLLDFPLTSPFALSLLDFLPQAGKCGPEPQNKDKQNTEQDR